MRRYTRLSTGFSRKLEDHAASSQLYRLQLHKNVSGFETGVWQCQQSLQIACLKSGASWSLREENEHK